MAELEKSLSLTAPSVHLPKARDEAMQLLDQGICKLEQLCLLAPGQLSLNNANQLIVDDLAQVETAFIALQKARGTALGAKHVSNISTTRTHDQNSQDGGQLWVT